MFQPSRSVLRKTQGVRPGGGRGLRGFAALAVVFFISGCGPSPEEAEAPQFSDDPPSAKVEYVFGVHPLHNPARLHQIFGPVVDYLNARIPDVQIRLEASRDYRSFEEKLYARKFAFALPNPYQTVTAAKHGYLIFGKMGDDENFRGIILVRKDSGIKSVMDLKGRAISYPAPTALAATMMPQYCLQTHGLDVMRDVENRYVGSQESAIMNVFLGYTAAGATWPPPWRLLSEERPELKRALDPIWITDSLPNNSLMVRDDVPESLAQRVAALLLHLHENEEGRILLSAIGLSKFEKADDATYRPVIDFLEKFVKNVRSPEK